MRRVAETENNPRFPFGLGNPPWPWCAVRSAAVPATHYPGRRVCSCYSHALAPGYHALAPGYDVSPRCGCLVDCDRPWHGFYA